MQEIGNGIDDDGTMQPSKKSNFIHLIYYIELQQHCYTWNTTLKQIQATEWVWDGNLVSE